MTNLNKKLLTIYLSLGIIFFIAVIYLFVKNEILPEINSDISHKVRLTSVRVIKNDYYNLKLVEDGTRYPEEESMVDRSIREKWQSFFLLVNQTDNLTYLQSNPFYVKRFKSPFSVGFSDDEIIPLTTLNDKYRLDIQEDGKIITSFEVPNLNNLLAISEKYDTVTAEKTIKLVSTDKRVILFLIFTID